MISINFVKTVMWSKTLCTLQLRIYNNGPETLYCGPDDGDVLVSDPYFLVSEIRFTPTLGETDDAFSNQAADLDFDIAEQPEGSRRNEWTCSYLQGVLSLKSKKPYSILKPKESIRVNMNVKNGPPKAGMANMKFRYCDWKSFNCKMGIAEEERYQKEQELVVEKLEAPSIDKFGLEDGTYHYRETACVEWEITGMKDTSDYICKVDGKDIDTTEKGSIPLFLADTSHVLELSRKEGISVSRTFWPRWFVVEKQEGGGKERPNAENTILLRWNITEADKCTVMGKEGMKKTDQMKYTVTEDTTKIGLEYFDTNNYIQKFEFFYIRPIIHKFQVQNKTNFIQSDQLEHSVPVVNGIYGGDEPWHPGPPVPEKVNMVVNCSAMDGCCYYRINGGAILEMNQEQQGKDQIVNVYKAGQYTLDLWDMYGCRVTGGTK